MEGLVMAASEMKLLGKFAIFLIYNAKLSDFIK